MKLVLLSLLLCLLALGGTTGTALRLIAEGFQRERDLVLSEVATPLNREKRQAVQEPARPTITNYHVISTVTARYVSTSVVVTAQNEANVSQEVQFGFRFKPEAFISGFVMIVDGIPYVAEVREKEEAQQAYDEARERGQGAGQVRQKDDSDSRFFVDLNLEPRKTVIFNLTYQELLRRDKGQFKHDVYVEPGQVVDDLRVSIRIIEPQGISSVRALWSPTSDNLSPRASFQRPSSSATVTFTPSPALQASASPEFGLVGSVNVTYDVEHDLTGGDIQIVNDYFVHYISPEGIPPAPKKVIFVIDVSGSMSGQKIDQTREVMVEILSQLREIDFFNVLNFSQSVGSWSQSVVQATPTNIQTAQAYVGTLRTGGGTDIHQSLVAAAQQFDETEDAFPAIFLLTDGRPTSGVTDTQAILTAVKEATDQKVALFCIGFGTDVDDLFMERLAFENHGLYRKIYVDSDAPSQMRDFFDEFATPLLYNIAVQYDDEAVATDTLIGGKFLSYFDGKELLVAGKVSGSYTGSSLNAIVMAKGRDRDFELHVSQEIGEVLDPDVVEDFSQRLWAFLTIKDLLAREKLSDSADEKDKLKETALELSLRYSFVTPLTSLLVIKPPDAETAAVTTPAPSDTGSGQESYIPTSRGYAPGSGQGSYIPTSRVGGDPHFVIDVPRSDLKICFDLHPENATFVNLLSDPNLGVYVRARIVSRKWDPIRPDDPEYWSILGVVGIELDNHQVLITERNIRINSRIAMNWGIREWVMIGDFNITVQDGRNLTITIGDSIHMRIELGRVSRVKQNEFDFFVSTDGGFSQDVNGVIGQFQYKRIHLESRKELNGGFSKKSGHTTGVLNIDGRKEVVSMKRQQLGLWFDCWSSEAETYIGPLEQYLVDDLFPHPEA